jgi:hypothetical protein
MEKDRLNKPTRDRRGTVFLVCVEFVTLGIRLNFHIKFDIQWMIDNPLILALVVVALTENQKKYAR